MNVNKVKLAVDEVHELFQSDFVRAAHPEESYRYAAEEACVSLSRLVER